MRPVFFLSALFVFWSTVVFAQLPDTVNFDKCRLIRHQVAKSASPSSVPHVRVDSPAGRFRFYYYTSGTDALYPLTDANGNGIVDYIDTIATESDLIFKKEVLDAGLPVSGLDSIPVYFTNLGSGLYGVTEQFQDGQIRISINCKVNGPQTKGMNMVRVTLAHEFHHVLHFQHRFWEEAFLFYYEMSATFFEEVCYDDINDYRFYLQNGIYQKVNVSSFYGNGGSLIYGGAILFQFIRDRYGLEKAVEIDKDIMTYSDQYSPAVSLAMSVESNLGIGMDDFFNQFALATLFTRSASDPDRFFREGAFFPGFRNNRSLEDTLSVPASGEIIAAIPVSQTGFSVRWLKTANGIFPAAISQGNFKYFQTAASTSGQDTVYLRAGSEIEGGTRLSSDLAVQFSSSAKEQNPVARIWVPENSSSVLVPVQNMNFGENKSILLYPNPLVFNQAAGFYLSGVPDNRTIQIQILSITGKKVFDYETTSLLNFIYVPFSGQSSGIYIVSVFSGQKLLKTVKLAVVK